MATFSKQIFSGSTNGTGITVVATATLGTTIHATGISATTLDEIWLYAANIDSTARTLTIEFGGVSVTKDLIQQSIAVAIRFGACLCRSDLAWYRFGCYNCYGVC